MNDTARDNDGKEKDETEEKEETSSDEETTMRTGIKNVDQNSGDDHREKVEPLRLRKVANGYIPVNTEEQTEETETDESRETQDVSPDEESPKEKPTGRKRDLKRPKAGIRVEVALGEKGRMKGTVLDRCPGKTTGIHGNKWNVLTDDGEVQTEVDFNKAEWSKDTERVMISKEEDEVLAVIVPRELRSRKEVKDAKAKEFEL